MNNKERDRAIRDLVKHVGGFVGDSGYVNIDCYSNYKNSHLSSMIYDLQNKVSKLEEFIGIEYQTVDYTLPKYVKKRKS